MRSGFTILETVIVLGIVAILVMFSVPSISKSQAHHQEQLFWSELRQNWRNAQLQARNARQTTNIQYDQTTKRITFATALTANSVQVPGTLRVVKFTSFQMHANGYVKPQTQEFASTLTGRRYLMRIQLAWGGYHVESINSKDG